MTDVSGVSRFKSKPASQQEASTAPFGFKVIKVLEVYDPEVGDDVVLDTPRWAVELPHRCDAWEITDNGGYAGGVSHDEAMRALRRFMAEAQDALDTLRRREET